MKIESILSNSPPFSFLQKYAKPLNKIGRRRIQDITHLPYIDLKVTVPKLLEAKKYNRAIAIVFGCSRFRAALLNGYKRIRILIWILNQYEKIKLLESKYLRHEPDADMINAGIRELDNLGHFVLIDMIAEKYGCYTHAEIERLKYSRIFDIQYRMAIEGKIQKNLIEIRKQNGRR